MIAGLGAQRVKTGTGLAEEREGSIPTRYRTVR
jgi:hypothetical protein